LPSKAAAEAAEHWLNLPSSYALASQGGAVEKEGIAALADLAGMVASADRVILLLAASDVSLLRVKTPPLTAAKLRLALPNLVEDQLMVDPSECVVVAGDFDDDLRTAAVAQRSWLDILAQAFTGYGARSLAMVPGQSCLPLAEEEGMVTAAVVEHGADLDLALRLAAQEAVGLPIFPETPATAAAEVLDAIRAIAPARPLHLYVAHERVPEFQAEIAARAAATGMDSTQVYADNWPRVIAILGKNPMNLMAGLGASSGPQVNWKQWRWAAILAVLIMLVNAIGLNVDWLRMRRESKSLNDSMIQIYKSAFPNETVIVDPMAQMQQKIANAERDSGQASADDFAQLAGNFAEVFNAELQQNKAHKTAASVIASIEYRDHSLLVHMKPENPVSMDKMKFSLAARNLGITSPSAAVWQIRSAK
jgi:general secretion pathway protein L